MRKRAAETQGGTPKKQKTIASNPLSSGLPSYTPAVSGAAIFIPNANTPGTYTILKPLNPSNTVRTPLYHEGTMAAASAQAATQKNPPSLPTKNDSEEVIMATIAPQAMIALQARIALQQAITAQSSSSFQTSPIPKNTEKLIPDYTHSRYQFSAFKMRTPNTTQLNTGETILRNDSLAGFIRQHAADLHTRESEIYTNQDSILLFKAFEQEALEKISKEKTAFYR